MIQLRQQPVKVHQLVYTGGAPSVWIALTVRAQDLDLAPISKLPSRKPGLYLFSGHVFGHPLRFDSYQHCRPIPRNYEVMGPISEYGEGELKKILKDG
jgi:hypothetical protein